VSGVITPSRLLGVEKSLIIPRLLLLRLLEIKVVEGVVISEIRELDNVLCVCK
jgi:hypothetical protein